MSAVRARPNGLFVVLAAVVAIAIALAWWGGGWPLDSSGVLSTDSEAAPEARREQAMHPREPVAGKRTRVAVERSLRVSVTVGGEPAVGRGVWAFAEDPLELSVALPPSVGDDAVGDGRGRATFTGDLSIDVPPGVWTIVRVRDGRRPMLTRHLRVPPFEGRKDLLVDLGRGRTALRVQAWTAGLTQPLADAVVRVRWESLGGNDEPREFELLTDMTGWAEIDGLEPGALLVRAPSARDTDPWPSCVRLVVTPYDVPRELACVIVEPEVWRTVRLSLFVEEGSVPRFAKVFLRSLEGGGALYPQAGVIGGGVSEDEVRVPVGAYEIGVLPLGAATPEPGSVQVSVDTTLRVRIRPPPTETRLELVGVSGRHFPLRVIPEADDDIAGLDALLLFFGPARWTLPHAVVGTVPVGSRLIALSRQATFLSAAPVSELSASSVDMRPATMFHVEWIDGSRLVDDSVVLDVEAGVVSLARSMRPKLTRVDEVFRPALAAQFVVPIGPVTLTAVTHAGRELWRRDVDAELPQQVVRIESPRR